MAVPIITKKIAKLSAGYRIEQPWVSPEVWGIDLQKRRLEAYRQLIEGEYSQIQHHREGQIVPEFLPEAVIELERLFQGPSGS